MSDTILSLISDHDDNNSEKSNETDSNSNSNSNVSNKKNTSQDGHRPRSSGGVAKTAAALHPLTGPGRSGGATNSR